MQKFCIIQVDLTEDGTTLPSVDIASSYAAAYQDSDFLGNTEADTKKPDSAENSKEQHLPHSAQATLRSIFPEDDPQKYYSSEDEEFDSSAITTVRSPGPPSYFARYLTRRNTENGCKSEADNGNFETKIISSEYWSDPYCTEKNEETIDNDETTKVNVNESENFTEKSLDNINAHEGLTEILL